MSVTVETMTIPGSLPEGTNPLPRFRRQNGFGTYKIRGELPPETAEGLGSCTLTLPYRMQDRYRRENRPVTLKTIVMENRYLRAVFTPQLGGKLWALTDKERGRELILNNPVLRPGNLGIRNAWTSGGIEWNFGSLGHTYFTCDNVFAAILKDSEGRDFLRIYEFERAKECVWQADFHLPEDSRRLFCHVRLTNPGDEDRTTYWWTNIAVPDDGGTRVLCSSRNVIALSGNALSFERLPFLSVMPGDMSYPHNATRSFDYFFQPDAGVRTEWEGTVDKAGFAFYDRSTAPLLYHKMFCWGNHRGGARWQEFLSEGTKGNYIEIQAGIAPSQMHDKLFPARSSFEWTQCYGGTQFRPEQIHGPDLEDADRTFGEAVDALISEPELLAADLRFREAADIPVHEEDIVHSASGWGALELRREKLFGGAGLPENLCFPESTLGPEQQPWLALLEDGVLPEDRPDAIPASWLTSPRWRTILEASLARPGGRTATSLLHYGNMLFEHWDMEHIASVASGWPAAERDRFEKLAEAAWLESDALRPSVWAKRNLAILEELRGNKDRAETYYDALFELPASRADFAFAAEYLSRLNSRGKYEKAWALLESLPEEIRRADRVTLSAAVCALRLNKLDGLDAVFAQEHADIREGENSLTDLWFEYNARKLGLARGMAPDELTGETLAALKEEAEENCPPPHAIDFRMSYDKKRQYRATE